jgi:hypothetical protein
MGGLRGASHKRVELVMKLPQLQNLIKRDSAGYKEEFLQQHRYVLMLLHLCGHCRVLLRVYGTEIKQCCCLRVVHDTVAGNGLRSFFSMSCLFGQSFSA